MHIICQLKASGLQDKHMSKLIKSNDLPKISAVACLETACGSQ